MNNLNPTAQGENGQEMEQQREAPVQKQGRRKGAPPVKEKKPHKKRRRNLSPEELAKDNAHIAVWNKVHGFKISGNSAPLRKNLTKYLESHPEMEIHNGQELDHSRAENWRMETETGLRVRLVNGRLGFRERESKKLVRGNCCPLFKNTKAFLEKFEDKFERHDKLEDDLKETLMQLERELEQNTELSEAAKVVYGPNRHDNILELPVTQQDEFPTFIGSRDLSILFD